MLVLLLLVALVAPLVAHASPIPIQSNLDQKEDFATFHTNHKLYVIPHYSTLTPQQFLATSLVRSLCGPSSASSLSPGGVLPRLDDITATEPSLIVDRAPSILQCGNGEQYSFVNEYHTREYYEFVQDFSRERKLAHEASLLTDSVKEWPFEAIDFLALTVQGVMDWALTFIEHHWGSLPNYADYAYTHPHTGIFSLMDGHQETNAFPVEPIEPSDLMPIRIGLAADWAAGTRESALVVQNMMRNFHAEYTIHLGDVYFVGSPTEIASNALGIAPKRAKRGVEWPHGTVGSLAVQGNHEMYSRGFGFFETWLPSLGTRNASRSARAQHFQEELFRKFGYKSRLSGQDGGYFMLQNKFWRVIGLDTGFHSYSVLIDDRNTSLPAPIIDWLVNVVDISNPLDKRGIIILTHHQPFSAFHDIYPASAIQLSRLIPKGRTFLWLYGHEHKLEIFHKRQYQPEPHLTPLSLYARCVGNSGFPPNAGVNPTQPHTQYMYAYDDRVFKYEHGFRTVKVGHNGFTRMLFKGANLHMDYHTMLVDSEASESVAQETFRVNEDGHVVNTGIEILNPNITIVHPETRHLDAKLRPF